MTYEQGMRMGAKFKKDGMKGQMIAKWLKTNGIKSRAGTDYSPIGALRAIGRFEADKKRQAGKRK